MIIAYHSIFSAYGFWLPNDPRGSWSDFVRRWELLRFGEATRVSTRHSLATRAHDTRLRLEAKQCLTRRAVKFTDLQARTIGKGFAQAVFESGYRVLACAIMPEHVHMVIAWRDRRIERIIAHFKARASRQLRLEGIHPSAGDANEGKSLPSPWGRNGWNVYLNTQEAVSGAIK